jgi:putative ABC transport system permease protein
VLALWSLKFLVQLIPADVPRLNAVGLDTRMLSFTFLISLVAGILFGLAPALRASKMSLTEPLKESGRGSGSGGKERSHLRDALVVSEVALAVVLLAGAGLLIQSFLHLTRVDPGFDSHRVLTFSSIRRLEDRAHNCRHSFTRLWRASVRSPVSLRPARSRRCL